MVVNAHLPIAAACNTVNLELARQVRQAEKARLDRRISGTCMRKKRLVRRDIHLGMHDDLSRLEIFFVILLFMLKK